MMFPKDFWRSPSFILGIVALLFSVYALVVTCLLRRQVTSLDKEFVAYKNLPVLSASEDTPQKSPSPDEVSVKVVCWNADSCDEGAAQGWEFRDVVFGTYTIRLGDPDADGEVHTLVVRNDKGATATIGELPSGLTYTGSFSDLDGGPVNDSPEVLATHGYQGFLIEVYDAIPLEYGDSRMPVAIKSIIPQNAF